MVKMTRCIWEICCHSEPYFDLSAIAYLTVEFVALIEKPTQKWLMTKCGWDIGCCWEPHFELASFDVA